MIVAVLLCSVSHGPAMDLHVNPETGSDTSNGHSSEIKDGNGPFKTIARAIKLAMPGDTIHLAPLTYTNECVVFQNKSGKPGHPITLDGHGAVIDGSDALVESDWHEISPGLYRNTTLYARPLLSSVAFVSRFALVMNGRLNRMGRSAKGRSDPYKIVADLRIGEWTYQAEDEHAFYLKVDPAKTLSSQAIRVPTRISAVQIYGNVSHVIIKNITGRHVLNDGFALTTGSALKEIDCKVRDIVYENVKAFECCDDGMSSHADCELRADGIVVDGCATGIANCGSDVIENLVTRNIHGVDVYYYGGRHVLKNSRVQVHGNVAALSLTTQYGNAKWLADPSRGALYEGWDRCVLQLENVAFDVSQTPATSSKKVLIADRCSLEANLTTLGGLMPEVKKGGSLRSDAAATTTNEAIQPKAKLHAPRAAGEGPAVHVVTRSADALGVTAINLTGAIHPHGRAAEYFFEYGPTSQYGSATPRASLPPRLTAFYRESWDENLGGWSGGMTLKDLVHHPTGGARGGFVRFSEPSGHDHNHDDGIGTLHLAKYLYPGRMGNLRLGGGEPDFRDAKVSLHVRGNAFIANGAELLWWTQSQSNPQPTFEQGVWRHANWAYTDFTLTDYLSSGRWERVAYRLRHDPAHWSYAGNNRRQQGFDRYSYWSIDNAQRHANIDFFHLLAFVNPADPPRGSIDFDEFELAYRNYSLVLPSNGGRLMRSPSGSLADAATLTDGWRNGDQRVWRSAANPVQPLEFVYAFNDPVAIDTIQLHQNPEWPAKDVEVLTSNDGSTFAPLRKMQLPEKGTPNATWASTFDTGLSAKATSIMVRVISGYKPAHWGLGEIEVFGHGAKYLPEDELNLVTTDIEGLKAGATYHYRLVAVTSGNTICGADQTFVLPSDDRPRAFTGRARRITQTTAFVEGRLNPMGLRTEYYFEFGPDANYGSRTKPSYGGLQITPRMVFAPLAGLKPGSTIHYRLVGVNATGTSHGNDAQFQTSDE